MAVVKRHWRLFATQLIVIAIIAMSCVMWLQKSATHAEVPGGGSPPPASVALEPLVFSRVAELRKQLALTNVDLSAMGCSREASQQILTQLVLWTQQHEARWTQAEQTQVRAESSLAEAHQQSNIGPRNEALPGQIATLQTAYDAARTEMKTILSEAASGVQSVLNAGQIEIWQDARGNMSLPEQFRFASNLTVQELASIETVYRQKGGDSSAGRQIQEQILGGGRAARSQLVRSNRAVSQEGVCMADNAVIVPPASYLPTTQPIPHQ